MIGNLDQVVNLRASVIWIGLEAACKGSGTKLKRIKNVILLHNITRI